MSLYDFAEPTGSLAASARLHIGAVRIATPDELIVLAEDALWTARRAAGCLVQPEVGDTVLLLAAEGRDFTILNVLERASRSPVSVTHADGIALRAPVISMVADEALRVRAPKAEMEFTTLSLRSAAATLVVRAGAVFADTLRTIATKIEQAAESLSIQATHRTAVVGGVDTLDAQAAHSKIETLVIQTGSTILTAEQDVRMDAERIALG